MLEKLGPLARMIGATVSNTSNPTVLNAGYKVNVIPGLATAEVDCRFLPGYGDELLAEIDGLLGPGVQREFIHHDIAVETTFDGPLCAAMTAALLQRTRQPRSFRTACPVGRMRSRSAGWASAASGSRPCACPLTWTSSGCSMAWTSGSLSTRSVRRARARRLP